MSPSDRADAPGLSRRQLITYAGAAAGAATLGNIAFSGGPASAAPVFNFPLEYEAAVNSPYGDRVHPITGIVTFHDGIDYAASEGIPIHAVASGTVDRVENTEGGYGRYTRINHGEGYYSFYGHQSLQRVRVGQYVAAGAFIGAVGNTGSSTGAHLHFGMHVGGSRADPARWMNGAPLPTRSGTTPPKDDDFAFIDAPGRTAAVIGPGYHRDLTTTEFYNAAEAIFGPARNGTDREFDVWKAVALQGTSTAAA